MIRQLVGQVGLPRLLAAAVVGSGVGWLTCTLLFALGGPAQ